MDERATESRAPDLGPDTWRSPGPRRLERLGLAIALIASVLLGVLLVSRIAPPEVVPASAAPELFSARRAWVHLERVARVPHPTGSDAARAVEAYITQTLRARGLRVESMVAPACTEAAGLHRCGNVRNVIGTVSGRTREPALLLSAHYDSVPNAPGAGDDGAAVAALLEVARVIAAGPPPERDVVFAFLDGEEELMLGAAAFCNDRGSRSIGLVANFDARGNRGAVTLVGASPGSAAQLARLIGGLSHPIVNSFYPSVASVLPNATDAEIYQRCGLPALSFAFADGFESYHQGTDDAERLDARSLQHHGSFALDVVRSFAAPGAQLPPAAEGGLVFFDVGGSFVVRYPFWLARACGVALLSVAVLVLLRQVRAGAVTAAQLSWAAAGGFATLLGAALLGALVVFLASAGWRPWSDYVYAPALTACAASVVSAALVALLGLAVGRGHHEMPRFAPALVWLCLAVACAAVAPGLSHLFTWPASALLMAAALPARTLLGRALARGIASLLAVLLLTPVAHALVVVVGAPGVAGAMVCLALLVGIWAEPVARLVARPRRLSALLLAVGVAGAMALRVAAATHPAPPVGNALAYALDAGTGQARWVSTDARRDAYQQLLLGSEPVRAAWPAFAFERTPLMREAPPAPLAPPLIELVSDGWSDDGQRTLRLRARSARAARHVQLWEATGVQFTRLRFDGVAPLALVRFSPELDRSLFRVLSGMDDGGLWSLGMYALGPEGVLLELTTDHAGPLELRCSDRSEGLVLPERGAPPRSLEWTEGYPGDRTLVSAPVLHVAALPPR